MNKEEIKKRLLKSGEEKFGDFQAKLIPTIDRNKIIGVRTPLLRKFAKELAKDPNIDGFLADLPHEYFEENNLHRFIISEEKDFNKAIAKINAFLPFIDNWATCDQTNPKAFKNGDGA
ncbi:MAG: DNA alkylation repair protein, partial [Clostridia bacterium]|nr:DNA alkylation repair protein [Clostridia bacterium]